MLFLFEGLSYSAPRRREPTHKEKTRFFTDQITPQRYHKKPVKIDQGLDFLKLWRGKSEKTVAKTKKQF